MARGLAELNIQLEGRGSTEPWVNIPPGNPYVYSSDKLFYVEKPIGKHVTDNFFLPIKTLFDLI